MDEVIEPIIINICNACLCTNESTLRSYTIQHQVLKSILQVEKLFLCGICQRLARYADVFIQNVQSSQIFLANHNNITASTLKMARSQIQPVLNLSCVFQDIIEVGKVNDGNVEDSISMIKIELKHEVPDLDENFEDKGVGDDSDTSVEEDIIPTSVEEDIIPLQTVIKEELEFEEEDLKCDRTLPGGAVIKQVFSENNKLEKKRIEAKEENRTESVNIETIRITKKQCMEEREARSRNQRYLDFPYKCEDCIKGFNLKEAYDRHREKHSKEMGTYECDICKQRTSSEEKLKAHRKHHEIRYKCGLCGLTRVCRHSVEEHYRAEHSACHSLHHCPLCPKTFQTLKLMKKHQSYVHGNKERVTCALCLKTYKTKEGLKTHMIRMHALELAAGAGADAAAARRWYDCETCGARFGTTSLLRLHRVKHSLRRDFYCVECDKGFKTNSMLQHHLKTVSPHVTNNELKLACTHCDKRFSVKRNLQRHINGVHLKVKPYECDKCDRAYACSWSLRQHKRLSHEGYKRPLKYPCTLCDKVFDRNQILKKHMVTHTGERAHGCARCPARFGQRAALHTHTRRVHLKLGRGGAPKAKP